MSNSNKNKIQTENIKNSNSKNRYLENSNRKSIFEENLSVNQEIEKSNRELLIKESNKVSKINNDKFVELSDLKNLKQTNSQFHHNNEINELHISENKSKIVEQIRKSKSIMRKIFINNPKKTNLKYKYLDNFVRSSIYTWYDFLPKSLLFQFRRYANIYFLFVTILQCIPEISPLNPITAVFPFVFVLCISMIREGFEDIKRHKQDAKENSLEVFKYKNDFLDAENYTERVLFSSETSKNLVVGDIVKVIKGTVIPADLILLSCSNNSKTAYIETSNLDGEKNLKPILCLQKTFNLLKNIEDEKLFRFRGKIRCIPPTAEISTFNGEIFLDSEKVSLKVDKKNFLYKGTTLKDTDWAIGIVVYTGRETKIILNINKASGKSSHLEMLINKLMILIFCIQVCLCIICAIGASFKFMDSFYRAKTQGENKQSYIIFLNEKDIKNGSYTSLNAGFSCFFSYLLLFNTMIPISLVVTLEMVKYSQAFFMMWDIDMYSNLRRKFVEVNSCSLNEEMGQIKYIFSDKTGTLTTNKLVFKKAFIWDTEFGKLPDELEGYNNNNEFYEMNGEKDLINSNKSYKKSNKNKHEDYKIKDKNNKKDVFEINNINQIKINNFPFHEVKAYSVYGKEGNLFNIELESANKKTILKLQNTRDLICQFLYCISLNQNCFINKSLKTKVPPCLRRMTTGNQKKIFDEKFSAYKHTETYQQEVNQNNIENWDINYTGESPDEIILTNSIKEMGVVYFEGDDRKKVLGVLKGANGSEIFVKEEFEILKVMEFNSERGMSSIIVKREGKIYLYSKGGDGKINLRLSENNNQNKQKIFEKVKSCSEKGYRVLCCAMKILDENEYQKWLEELNDGLENLNDDKEKERFSNEKYLEIEKGLILLGCTVVEDKLQDNVPETIKELQSAGINIWILTGDNLETARNIGISCNLLPEKMQKFFLYGDLIKMKKNMQENLNIFLDNTDSYILQEAISEIKAFQEEFRNFYPVIEFNPDKNGVDKVFEDYIQNENLKFLLYVSLKKIKERMERENQNPEFNGILRGLIIEMACLNCILPPPIKNFPSKLYNHPLSQLFLDVALATQAVVCCR